MRRDPGRRWRPLPPLPDALLALGLLLGAGLVQISVDPPPVGTPADGSEDFRVDQPTVLLVALLVAQLLPVAWRRRRPVTAFTVVSVAMLGYLATGHEHAMAAVAESVLVWTVAVRRAVRVSGAVLLIDVASWWTVVTALELAAGDGFRRVEGPGSLAAGTAWITLVWAAGVWTRHRRTRAVRRAEAARQERLTRLVAEERRHIARELHDLAAHHLSGILVQAQVARVVLTEEPDTARDALDSIQHSGAGVLLGMHRLVEVLGEDTPGPVSGLGQDAPGPVSGLGDLNELVTHSRRCGLPVRIRVEGPPRRLPVEVDLVGYRIVQEALANTRRHAGAARAEVVIQYGNTGVTVSVRDDGRGIPRGRRSGFGLVGMRERVALLDGHVYAGPAPGGGWLVEARLPAGRERAWASAS